jgi:hypothetical protein
MRIPQKRSNRGIESRIFSISAPVGGLNARDPLARMKETDAVTIDNLWCTPYDVMVREGYSVHSSGAPGEVNTLASYENSTAAAKLFAWADDKVFDASIAGALGTEVVSGNNSSKFQCINFGTAAGIFLVACSGVDLPLVYNGSVWSNIFSASFSTTVTSLTSVGTTATATMTNPHNLKTGMSVTVSGFTPAEYNGTYVITVTGANTFTYTFAGAGVVTVTGSISPTLNLTITGVDPSLFVHVAAFKSRLWFVERDSTKVWYMPTLSIGGAAASIDFNSLFTKGGYLVAMGNWSLDAGYGMDDYAVFISSNGQAVVYKGTDPASSSTWALIGVYDIGSPIGRRCFTKYAGDLALICRDGLVLLSQALMSTRVNSKTNLTDKIQNTIGTYINAYYNVFGWEAVLFPQENMLLLNVPISSTESYQLAMNTISGAWSSFSGWNAHCWVLHEDHIYFGGSDFVAKAWDTNADNSSNINFEAQQSFSYCGSRGLKRLSMIRPIISANGSPTISIGVNVDYDMTDPTGLPTFSPVTTAIWDTSVWDVGVWAGDLTVKRDWQTTFAMGYCLSTHLKGATQTVEVRWSSTDLMIMDAGVL